MMQTVALGPGGPQVPRLVQGCMRFDELSQAEATRLVAEDVQLGVVMFDNADIYGAGDCEVKCGRALREAGIPRDAVVVQTKCGIENHMYDFSKQHILKAVEDSLARLGTEYVDVLLLHRPDALAEPEQIAEALSALQDAGKVKQFGVSNMHPMQIELLQKYIRQPLVANQLQLSPVHSGMIDSGILVNTTHPGSEMRDGMILDYCRLKDIRIQAWSPFQKGHMEGAFLKAPEYQELNDLIAKMAGEKGTNPEAIVAAWLLRHPAKIQVILGTTKPQRMRDAAQALDHPLTHDEWYQLYMAAGHYVP